MSGSEIKDGIQLGELEEATASSPFMQKYVLWEQILNELTNDISIMMKELVKDPEVVDGKEVFPANTASLTIESSLYAHNLIKSSREVKQSLVGCYNALKSLKELENE